MDQMVLKRSKVTILSCKYSRVLFLSDALEKNQNLAIKVTWRCHFGYEIHVEKLEFYAT